MTQLKIVLACALAVTACVVQTHANSSPSPGSQPQPPPNGPAPAQPAPAPSAPHASPGAPPAAPPAAEDDEDAPTHPTRHGGPPDPYASPDHPCRADGSQVAHIDWCCSKKIEPIDDTRGICCQLGDNCRAAD